MKPKSMVRKLKHLSARGLETGCLWLLPYLLLYFYFWITDGRIAILRILFLALHLWFGAVAIAEFQRKFKTIPVGSWIFWIGLFLFFLIPGAYLEFPADPWEHLNRIYLWNGYEFIYNYPTRQKFAYFWGWTLIGWVRLPWRELALDCYSTFWQMLVSIQVYRVFRTLDTEPRLARLCTFFFVCVFGTNIFGLRYYSLSSFMMAFVAYLYIVFVLIRWINKTTPFPWFKILSVFALAFANHLQEVLFIAIITLVAGSARFRRKTFLYLFVFALTIFSYLVAKPEGLTILRTFDIFNRGLPYIKTLGILGFLGLAGSFLIFSRSRLLFFLTWTPVLLCFWPPFTILFLRSTDPSNTYRILYAWPAAALLPLVLNRALEFTILVQSPRKKFAIVCLMSMLLLLPFSSNWGSRLYFQTMNPNSELWLRDLLPISQWTESLPHKCLVITDRVTGWSIQAHHRYPEVVFGSTDNRLDSRSPLHYQVPGDALKHALQYHDDQGLCAFVLRKKGSTASIGDSLYGAKSMHWDKALVRRGFEISDEMRDYLTNLAREKKWIQVSLHPDYDVFVWPPLMEH